MPTTPVSSGELRETADFFRSDRLASPTLIRTAARLLIAPAAQATPASVNDVIDASVGTFLSKTGWTDLGFTKGGSRITRQISDDGFSIDSGGRIIGMRSISSVEVDTSIADMSLDGLATAWGNAVTTVSASERKIGGGVLPNSPLRRLVLAHPIYSRQAYLAGVRIFVFPFVEQIVNEQQLAYSKSGDAQNLPVKFRSVADPSELDVSRRFVYVLEVSL
jgi:hypothetical protein